MGNHIHTCKDPQEQACTDLSEQLPNFHLLSLLDYSQRPVRAKTCRVFCNLGNRKFSSLRIIKAACSDYFHQILNHHLYSYRIDLLRQCDLWCNRSAWSNDWAD